MSKGSNFSSYGLSSIIEVLKALSLFSKNYLTLVSENLIFS